MGGKWRNVGGDRGGKRDAGTSEEVDAPSLAAGSRWLY